MKHILLILTLCGPLYAAAQQTDLENMPKAQRDSVLIALAKEAVLRIGPDYYREDYPPLVEEFNKPARIRKAPYVSNPDFSQNKDMVSLPSKPKEIKVVRVSMEIDTSIQTYKGIEKSPISQLASSEGKNYIVTFRYDPAKERLEQGFAVQVVILAKDGIPDTILFGDGSIYGIKNPNPEHWQKAYNAHIGYGRKGLVNEFEVRQQQIKEEMRPTEAKQAAENKEKGPKVMQSIVRTVYDSTFLQQPPRK